MKKVFYDSKVAKAILFDGYSTITIFAWVLTVYKKLTQETINHECTHARQWIELTVASWLIALDWATYLGLFSLVFGFTAHYILCVVWIGIYY